jgi:hypothetical protein
MSSSATPPPQVRPDSPLPLHSLFFRSWVDRIFIPPFLLFFLLFVDLRARVDPGKTVFRLDSYV